MEKEALLKQIDNWIEESEDQNFDTYLQHVKEELEKPGADVAHIEKNVRENRERYFRNLEMRRKTQTQPEMPQTQDSVEFKIGAWVLSVVGAVFILIALVILGKEFLSDFLQGMGLYICALVVILFSELFLYRRQAKIATIFTGLGIGSLYLITLINYLFLEILPVGLAISIAAVIGVSAVLLAQKREGAVIRIINILGIYVCMTPFFAEKGAWQFVAVSIIIGIVNIMSLFIRAEEGRTAAEVVQIVCVGFYTLILGMLGSVANDFTNTQIEVYVLCYLVLAGIIFLKMKKQTVQLWIWGIFTTILSIGSYAMCYTWHTLLFLGVFAVIYMGIFWMARKMEYKEVLYGVMSVMLVLNLQVQMPEEVNSIVMMGMIFALSMFLLFVPQLRIKRKNLIAWLALGILGFCSMILPAGMQNTSGFHVETFQYMYIHWKCEYWICTMIGIVAIVVLVHDRFGIKKKWRGIVMAGYLTYMFGMAGIEQELIVSILLMAVALGAIAAGFIQREKVARIYGLCLSLVVCVKLVLWDFWYASSLYKMLAFLIVGILALGISMIYIILEKKNKSKL